MFYYKRWNNQFAVDFLWFDISISMKKDAYEEPNWEFHFKVWQFEVIEGYNWDANYSKNLRLFRSYGSMDNGIVNARQLIMRTMMLWQEIDCSQFIEDAITFHVFVLLGSNWT